ncbi:MAG: hypothetical protein AUF79_13530 [Crenarchaeota archaeon 13_1_20CM_2_51_8]|nr:MAG: hypothetical protein AUF79_13530 [Crenarchaeota archaeon 13_1_20CM_2_51_8]
MRFKHTSRRKPGDVEGYLELLLVTQDAPSHLLMPRAMVEKSSWEPHGKIAREETAHGVEKSILIVAVITVRPRLQS